MEMRLTCLVFHLFSIDFPVTRIIILLCILFICTQNRDSYMLCSPARNDHTHTFQCENLLSIHQFSIASPFCSVFISVQSAKKKFSFG